MAIVVMGVSGSGKTTVGKGLAVRLGLPFHDADDFHPPANIDKMSAGHPLNDDDREPWLKRLNQVLRDEPAALLACSALKRSYRDTLRADQPTPVTFVYLKAPQAAIAERMAARDHFFPADLLDSQFAALEEPTEDEAIVIDGLQTPDQLVADIAARLKSNTGG